MFNACVILWKVLCKLVDVVEEHPALDDQVGGTGGKGVSGVVITAVHSSWVKSYLRRSDI